MTLPPMVTIPAGFFNGVAIDSFKLGRTPVTNAEYADHVDQFLDRPFVLLATSPDTHATSLVGRAKTPQDLFGSFTWGRIFELWDTRDPLTFGILTLFQLRKDMSPEGFDRPAQPVVDVSWFHAFEYAIANGLFLPSGDQWEYAARGPERHEFGTQSGKLTRSEAHYASESTADVGSYPSNGFGLQDMAGNVWEWTQSYGLRGGCWGNVRPVDLRVSYRGVGDPIVRAPCTGFRVGAPAAPPRFNASLPIRRSY